MRQIQEKIECQKCGNNLSIKKIYKLTWRYNDKIRTYRSGVKIIHTGASFLCKKCLNDFVKS